jgi:hypothetical protein
MADNTHLEPVLPPCDRDNENPPDGVWGVSVVLDDEDGLHLDITLDGATRYVGFINMRSVGVMAFQNSGRFTVGFSPMDTVNLIGYFHPNLAPLLAKKLCEAIPKNRFWWHMDVYVNGNVTVGWISFFWDHVNHISIRGTTVLIQAHMMGSNNGLVIEHASREAALVCIKRIMSLRKTCPRLEPVVMVCDGCNEQSIHAGRLFRLPSEEKGGWTTHRICDKCMHGTIMDAAWKHHAWTSEEARKRLRSHTANNPATKSAKK